LKATAAAVCCLLLCFPYLIAHLADAQSAPAAAQFVDVTA